MDHPMQGGEVAANSGGRKFGASTIPGKILMVIGIGSALGLISGLFILLRFRQLSSQGIQELVRIMDDAEAARHIQLEFKKQIQEWKNLLLRGEAREDFEAYRALFLQHEDHVIRRIEHLQLRLPDGSAGRTVVEFRRLHEELGRAYRDGLGNLRLGADFREVDRSVRGRDRSPTDLMDRVVGLLENRVIECRLRLEAGMDSRSRWGATAAALCFLVVLGISLRLGWHITRPIQHLSKFIQAVGRTGAYSLRAPQHSRDEVGVLASGLNRMLAEIEDRDAKLRRGRDELEARVIERTGELARHEARTRAILEGAGEGIIGVGAAGLIESANPAAERIFGCQAERLVGRPLAEFVHVPPGSGVRGPGPGQETTGRRADGTTFPVEIVLREVSVGEQVMYSGILRDITERRKVDRLKNEFVSTVSHELRTPLTSIKGSLGLVLTGVGGTISAKSRTMLDIAAKNCDRLVRLVNDILDIQKIESGSMPFRLKSVDMNGLVGQAVETNRAYAQALGVTLEIGPPSDPVRVIADQDRLLQVITNLVSNACKFSPPGSAVQLDVRREGGLVRTLVTDRGQGIPEEFRGQIFQKFAQADGSDGRQKQGTGLGLSICKAIVEKLGGTIGFDSRIGEGTCFHFELPAEQVPEVAAPGDSQARARILVCEDEPDIAAILREAVGQAGFEVDVASTSREAKALLGRNVYAAMTLDLMLPDQNGIALVQDLRRDPRHSELPIVVVSAHLEESRGRINSAMFGIVDWLEKPIDPLKLQAALRRSVDRGSGRPCVLHVEDDADLRQVVASVLADIADVASISTLEAARHRLDRRMPDLILLDLGLPDGSGLDLLTFLRERGQSSVPVMIFTALDASNATAREVVATMLKSKTSNEELVDRIRSFLRPALMATRV
jgi:PAS domain S-box-containing protein